MVVQQVKLLSARPASLQSTCLSSTCSASDVAPVNEPGKAMEGDAKA